MLTVHSPAKVILCGEHAVVYGYPAIAVPVFRHTVSVTIRDSQDVFSLNLLDLDKVLGISDNDPLVLLVMRVFADILSTAPSHVALDVRSSIPMASGLGSGASVASALVKSIFSFSLLRSSYDYAKINDYVFEVEKHYHGTPSGIDNTVIVYEKPVYFKTMTDFRTFNAPHPLHLLVADTGVPASTKITVGHVRSLYEKHPEQTKSHFEAIHQLVTQAMHHIEQGEAVALGKVLTENHAYLQKLEVSTPFLDKLVNAALTSGALGAKLSGGGGGGNMIALVEEQDIEKVSDALYLAGAKNVFSTNLQTR